MTENNKATQLFCVIPAKHYTIQPTAQKIIKTSKQRHYQTSQIG